MWGLGQHLWSPDTKPGCQWTCLSPTSLVLLLSGVKQWPRKSPLPSLLLSRTGIARSRTEIFLLPHPHSIYLTWTKPELSCVAALLREVSMFYFIFLCLKTHNEVLPFLRKEQQKCSSTQTHSFWHKRKSLLSGASPENVIAFFVAVRMFASETLPFFFQATCPGKSIRSSSWLAKASMRRRLPRRSRTTKN